MRAEEWVSTQLPSLPAHPVDRPPYGHSHSRQCRPDFPRTPANSPTRPPRERPPSVHLPGLHDFGFRGNDSLSPRCSLSPRRVRSSMSIEEAPLPEPALQVQSDPDPEPEPRPEAHLQLEPEPVERMRTSSSLRTLFGLRERIITAPAGPEQTNIPDGPRRDTRLGSLAGQVRKMARRTRSWVSNF